MPIGITFEWDSRHLSVWRGGGVERALASALSKAGSGAVRAMKAESSRLVRERKRMRVAFVNRALPLTFPSSKEIGRLAWRMDVSGALVPVSAFPLRQTRKGISVAINTRARSFIRSAFVATMRSGHKGVFLRKAKARLPIREAFTTRVVDVFRDEDMVPSAFGRAESVFGRDFARLLPLEMKKIRSK